MDQPCGDKPGKVADGHRGVSGAKAAHVHGLDVVPLATITLYLFFCSLAKLAPLVACKCLICDVVIVIYVKTKSTPCLLT